MIANRNQLWGRVVAEELARSGVTEVCLSPGSRSTPLALGLHQQKGMRITTHLDERSAAFFALGIGKATRRPAVLVCTSGTAAANYLPAIVEAHQARVPLIVLTADRPPELQHVGANQAIDQQALYGRHVRWFVDVGLPQATAARIRHLRALVCRAVARASAWPPGAVHLNFPLQEPLEPTPVPGDVDGDWHRGDLLARDGRSDGPFLRVGATRPVPDDATLTEVRRLIADEPEGVIVVGPRFPDEAFAAALGTLSSATGFPILADPVSGVRYTSFADPSTTYDAWLAAPGLRSTIRPGLVLRFGAAPTSKNLLRWLHERSDATHIVVTESESFGEETSRATHMLVGDAAAIAHDLVPSQTSTKPSSTAERIAALEHTTREFLQEETPQRAFEGAVVQRVVQSLPDDTDLFVSSSLPIRDLDRFGITSRRLRVHANRGASGIDGVTSTALGVLHARGNRTVLITGDLAFLHDLTALVTRQRLGLNLDVVLLDNGGGGIFEFLPIAEHEPPFTELFVTPHATQLAPLAGALGFDVIETDAQAAVRDGFVWGAEGAARLFLVKTDRKENVRHRRELEAALDARLAAQREAVPRAH